MREFLIDYLDILIDFDIFAIETGFGLNYEFIFFMLFLEYGRELLFVFGSQVILDLWKNTVYLLTRIPLQIRILVFWVAFVDGW